MKYKILMALMIVALTLIPLSCHQQQEIPPQDWVVANETEFLAKCEHCNIIFEKSDSSGGYVSYYYDREIDGAVVELDQIVYIFDTKTGELFDKYVHWRNDLPDKLPPIISEEEAMAIGGGTRAYLLYIDPESSVSLVEPTPTNPCWEVAVYEEFLDPVTNKTVSYNTDIVVVDAVTGEILGHGVPIP